MEQAKFEAFRSEAVAKGSDEVLVREWPAAKVLETHKHPFSVWARVVQGEMWLTVGNEVRHLRSGDEFTVDRDVPHSERYGAQGATLWVGRRHGARSNG